MNMLLSVVLLFFSVVITCFAVGGKYYIEERYKVRFYVKDNCLVRSATYETLAECVIVQTKSKRISKCYVAVWQVQVGQNGTFIEKIQSSAEHTYKYAQTIADQYKVCSTSS